MDDKWKKLSVIVPVYNAEKYLERCVDSILQQTYRNLEVILIDDGSVDHSPQICDYYREQDSRVVVIHKKNAGVAEARNSGIKIATGDYMTFVDSDDYIDQEMYSEMLNVAKEYDCDFILCDCMKEFGTHQQLYTHPIREGYYNLEQLQSEYYPHLLMMENVEYPATISNWVCVVRNKKEEEPVLYEAGIRYSEDLLFGARVMRRSNSFYYMKGKAFYHYYMNPESATHRFVPDKWNDYVKLYRKITEYFLTDPVYDFRLQIDLCLLFFLYNATGDIWNTNALNRMQKKTKIKEIVMTKEVRQMFKRLRVLRLPISYKLKIMTLLYKYKMVWMIQLIHLLRN